MTPSSAPASLPTGVAATEAVVSFLPGSVGTRVAVTVTSIVADWFGDTSTLVTLVTLVVPALALAPASVIDPEILYVCVDGLLFVRVTLLFAVNVLGCPTRTGPPLRAGVIELIVAVGPA